VVDGQGGRPVAAPGPAQRGGGAQHRQVVERVDQQVEALADREADVEERALLAAGEGGRDGGAVAGGGRGVEAPPHVSGRDRTERRPDRRDVRREGVAAPRAEPQPAVMDHAAQSDTEKAHAITERGLRGRAV
jgi:hypothetical protein